MSRVSPWTPSHVRYAETIAIRLAIHIIGLGPCPANDSRHIGTDGLVAAARHLGAQGVCRTEALADLAALLTIHRVRLIPTIRRALALSPPVRDEQQAA